MGITNSIGLAQQQPCQNRLKNSPSSGGLSTNAANGPLLMASVTIVLTLSVVPTTYSQVREEEPNDQLFQAQTVSLQGVESGALTGSLTGSPIGFEEDDVDYFSVTDLDNSFGDSVVIVGRSDIDLMLGRFSSSGALIATADNGPIGERFYQRVPRSGALDFGVTGWADNGYHNFLRNIADHHETGDYTLEISLVDRPTPRTQPIVPGSARTVPFQTPDGIVRNPDTGNYFVLQVHPSPGSWDVVQVDPLGIEISRFGEDEIGNVVERPRGITLGPNGNLLLVGANSGNIREISTSGQPVDRGIDFPTLDRVRTDGLAFDPVTETIWGLEPFDFLLREYDLEGHEVGRLDYSKILVNELDIAQGLTIDPSNGNFWIVGTNGPQEASALFQVSRSGELISKLNLARTFGLPKLDPEGVTIDADTRTVAIALEAPNANNEVGNLIGVVQLPPAIAGDFNADEIINVDDIDLLATAMQADRTYGQYDLNKDGDVESDDHRIWVTELAGTRFGDTNLDGQVNFSDFLALSTGFEKEGGWANGDFDGSMHVDFADFLLLSDNFGNQRATTVSAVPEPSTMILLVGMICLAGCRWPATWNRQLRNS